MELAQDQILERTELPGSKIDDELVFFNQSSGTYYGTGVVGASICEYLETPRSIAQICEHLLTLYEVEPEVCQSQVQTFVQELLTAGIVQEAAK